MPRTGSKPMHVGGSDAWKAEEEASTMAVVSGVSVGSNDEWKRAGRKKPTDPGALYCLRQDRGFFRITARQWTRGD